MPRWHKGKIPKVTAAGGARKSALLDRFNRAGGVEILGRAADQRLVQVDSGLVFCSNAASICPSARLAARFKHIPGTYVASDIRPHGASKKNSQAHVARGNSR